MKFFLVIRSHINDFLQVLLLILLVFQAQAQDFIQYPIQVDTVQSKTLEDDRTIKIYLPKEYSDTSAYPVLYVMDGEWMFELTVPHVHQLIEFDVIPPCIVVGVFHKNRDDDIGLNWDTGQFSESSAKFKSFLQEELIPNIDQRFATSGFNALIGHSNSAAYGHTMLIQENQPFRGIISLSTMFFGDMRKRYEAFVKQELPQKYFYFVASGLRDGTERLQSGMQLDSIMQMLPNPNLSLEHRIYPADHNGVAARGIQDGIVHLFSDFRHFTDWESTLIDSLNQKGIGPMDYVQEIETRMEEAYGIQFPFNTDDFYFLVSLAQTGEQVAELEQFELKRFGLQEFHYMGYAQYYEFVKDYKRAIQYWEKHFEVHYKPTHSFLAHRRLLRLLKRGVTGPIITIAYAEEAVNRFPEYALEYHYEIAYLASKHLIKMEVGKKSLAYCQKHYKENDHFDQEDLDQIKF